MRLLHTELPGVIICEPDVYEDNRGYFFEAWNRMKFSQSGIRVEFVQDNVSKSTRGVLRGLHYQWPYSQAKFVQVLEGEIWDVAADIRSKSPTFGKWVGVTLTGENHRQFFIPEGFAHGFCVLSETAIFHYKCNDYYHPEADKGILWNDPQLSINWPIKNPILSEKDIILKPLAQMDKEDLPVFDHD